MSGRKPAYSFAKRLDPEGVHWLNVGVWPSKSGRGDVISIRVRKNEGGQWGEIARLALYHEYSSGRYWELGAGAGAQEAPPQAPQRKAERFEVEDAPFDAPNPEDL